jgi:hypothetical protein
MNGGAFNGPSGASDGVSNQPRADHGFAASGELVPLPYLVVSCTGSGGVSDSCDQPTETLRDTVKYLCEMLRYSTMMLTFGKPSPWQLASAVLDAFVANFRALYECIKGRTKDNQVPFVLENGRTEDDSFLKLWYDNATDCQAHVLVDGRNRRTYGRGWPVEMLTIKIFGIIRVYGAVGLRDLPELALYTEDEFRTFSADALNCCALK